MKLWQVRAKDLQEIKREPLNNEQRLEDWVVKYPSILGIDVLLIGRQVSEWVVWVKWEKTFSRDRAKWFSGGFANQNIVCLLRDPATVDFLRKKFQVQ